jgi:hypothetical protein
MTKTQTSGVVAILAFGAAVCFTVHCGTGKAYRGQSGSEVTDNGAGHGGSEGGNGVSPGGDVAVCPCGRVGAIGPGPYAVLRVTLLEQNPGTFESALFPWCRSATTPAGANDVSLVCSRLRLRVDEVLMNDFMLPLGAEVEVVSDGFLPCYRGTDDLAVGERALATLSWPSLERLDEEPAAHLAPWGESIVFARTEQGEFSVQASELEALWGDLRQCLERVGNWHEVYGAFPGDDIP